MVGQYLSYARVLACAFYKVAPSMELAAVRH